MASLEQKTTFFIDLSLEIQLVNISVCLSIHHTWIIFYNIVPREFCEVTMNWCSGYSALRSFARGRWLDLRSLTSDREVASSRPFRDLSANHISASVLWLSQAFVSLMLLWSVTPSCIVRRFSCGSLWFGVVCCNIWAPRDYIWDDNLSSVLYCITLLF